MNRFPILLLALTMFAGACRRHSVKLSFTNARNEVPVLGNLEFRFSSNLATDSMLNQWDSTSYISFTPAIRGQFRWEAKDLLVFSPSGPLPPATSFQAHFSTKHLLKGSDFNELGEADNINFRTPALALERQILIWTKAEGDAEVVPMLEMHFNYPVSPKAMETAMVVQVDG
ncbi:MAG TPA: hypothetical protein VK907_13415, partial [Phnomibacter sp.]|nr:hypothetical protein [Phnomibacter sp.]